MIDINTFQAAYFEKEMLPPYQISFDGKVTYTQIDGEENYTSDLPLDVLTYSHAELLAKYYPYYKSHPFHLQFPPILNYISYACRLKIARLVQMHLAPAEPIYDPQLLDFFTHYETYTTTNQYMYRDFKACRYAAHDNDAVALGLMMAFGPLKTKNFMQEGECFELSCLKIEADEVGIIIEFTMPPKPTQLLHSACLSILNNYLYMYSHVDDGEITPEMIRTIRENAYRSIYTYNNYNMSFPANSSAYIFGAIENYISAVTNAFNNHLNLEALPFPALPIEFPILYEDILKERGSFEVLIPYEDFTFTNNNKSVRRAQSNQVTGNYLNLLNLWKHADEVGGLSPDKLYTCDEVRSIFKSVKVINRAKERGYIVCPSRGKYKLAFLSQPRPADSSNESPILKTPTSAPPIKLNIPKEDLVF